MAQFEAILRRSHDALDGTLASFFSRTRRSSPRRPARMARPPGESHDWAAGARRVVGPGEGLSVTNRLCRSQWFRNHESRASSEIPTCLSHEAAARRRRKRICSPQEPLIIGSFPSAAPAMPCLLWNPGRREPAGISDDLSVGFALYCMKERRLASCFSGVKI